MERKTAKVRICDILHCNLSFMQSHPDSGPFGQCAQAIVKGSKDAKLSVVFIY